VSGILGPGGQPSGEAFIRYGATRRNGSNPGSILGKTRQER
jgi:hypothetical protein